jgi:GAF domain-containing protein
MASVLKRSWDASLSALRNDGNITAARDRRQIAVVVGLLIVAAIALADADAGPRISVLGTLGLAPFATVVIGATPADTLFVALVAAAVAFGGGYWDHTAGAWTFYLRWIVVVVSGGFAVVVAVDRDRRELSRQRFELLTRISRVGNERSSASGEISRLARLLVPQVADIAIFYVVHRGEDARVYVRAAGAGAEEAERLLRDRASQFLGPSTDRAAGRPLLVEDFTTEPLERLAVKGADLKWLPALQLNSMIVLPLEARGEPTGTLALLVTAESGRHFRSDDLDFASVLAGRAALAIDNAGLSRQLTQLEQRLVAALGSLAEAVAVQDTSGAVIYANDAALQLLGVTTVEELAATTGATIGDWLRAFDETGRRVGIDDLPSARILAGERDVEPMLLQGIDPTTLEERWLLTKSSAVTDDEGHVISVVSVIEDVTESKRVELANRLLGDVSEILASSLDYEETLQRLAELAVERLADWCTVVVADEHGDLERVALASADATESKRIGTAGNSSPELIDEQDVVVQQVFREGRSLVVNPVPEETRATEPQGAGASRIAATMTVPLRDSGRVVGVISLVLTGPGRSFSDADLELAEELGRRAGVAIENARAYGERSKIADTLQEALRPPELTAPEGWTLATWYAPAGQENTVGGDFYDMFPVVDGHVLLIGDVTGHGAVAARLTGLARFTLRTAAELTQDPTTALQRLNAALLAQSEASPVSAVCAHLAPRAGGRTVRARFAVAGHPLPLLLRDGELVEVASPGTLAGANASGSWPANSFDLQPGDTLVLYTDGVTEARRGSDLFGRERLSECLRAGSPEPAEVLSRLQAGVSRFQRGQARDDMTVLALRLSAVSDDSPAPRELRRRAVVLERLRGALH